MTDGLFEATFTLPIPPPLNNMYINSAHGGRFKSPVAKRWTTEAGWELKRQKVAPLRSEKYGVTIFLPAKMAGDIDGRIKPILDLLVKHEITADDRHCASVMAARSDLVSAGTCQVSLSVSE